MPNRPRKYQQRKKFRCGRLVLDSNGTIKPVALKDGGGTRSCLWRYGQMYFHDVHQALLKVYKLRKMIILIETIPVFSYRSQAESNISVRFSATANQSVSIQNIP